MVFFHILKKIKILVKKKKFSKIETSLVIILQNLIRDSDIVITKRIIKLLMRLFYKRIWTSKKIVNLIASSMESKDQKLNLMVSRFMIQTAEKMYFEEESDQEDENLEELTKEFGKKYKNSKKKIEKLERQIKNLKKKEKRLQKIQSESNVYPIDMVYNV